MSKPIEITEIVLQNPTFKLRATGDKEHQLRRITSDDYSWMQEKHRGFDEKLSEGSIDFGVFYKLLFRLLEDKSDFLPIDEENVFDDDGELVAKRRVTGPQRLARAIEMSELPAVTEAFQVAMGLKAQESGSEDKKKQQ